ncbi:MAG: hypothetical protein ACYCZX_16490 [Rhodospirillaceae bacterium]
MREPANRFPYKSLRRRGRRSPTTKECQGFPRRCSRRRDGPLISQPTANLPEPGTNPMLQHSPSAEVDTAPPPVTKTDVTHFDFQARVFDAPGARFMTVGQTRKPAFCVTMGGFEAFVEVHALCREFDIAAGSHDARLVTTAIKGLKYVQDIRKGDKIPSELLDGSASWTVERRHLEIATNRIQVQLVSWLQKREIVISDVQELEMFFAQLDNREKLRTAFGDAAVALGFERTDTAPVMARIEQLAREICYIEALRDRYKALNDIDAKLVQVRRLQGSDVRMRDEIRRVFAFMAVAQEECARRFGEIDAQTGEIIGALKSIDRQIRYIRDKRDELHQLAMLWEPVITAWTTAPLQRSRKLDEVIDQTYRFLAQRYARGRSIIADRSRQTEKVC